MAKALKAKYKICKNIKGIYKNIWAAENAARFRSVKIFKQNSFLIKQKLDRLSNFTKYLNTKQIIKNFYSSLHEKKFQVILKKSIKSKTKTLQKLISLFESRIDIILFRACLVSSLYMARQLINHGFVYKNSKKITSKHTQLFLNDFIEIKKNCLLKKAIIKILNKSRFKRYHNLLIKKTNVKNAQTKLLSFLLLKRLNLKNFKNTNLLQKLILRLNSTAITKLNNIDPIPIYLEIDYKLLKIFFLGEPILKQIYYPIKIAYKKHNKSLLYSYNEILYND